MSSLRLFVLILLCIACKNQGNTETAWPKQVRWQQIAPPREGLECWQTYAKAPYDRSGTYVVQCWPVEVR